MNEQDLKYFLEMNKKRITTSNANVILKRVYTRTKEIDPKILFDFMGQVLIEKPKLQEGKKRVKFITAYNKSVAVRMLPRELLKMEKYFLKNYCLFDGEKLLYSFYGLVQYNQRRIYFHDRVFITNYRIIISDVIKPKGGLSFIPFAGISANILGAITNRALVAGTKYKENPSEPINAGRAAFGFEFPILDPTQIALSWMTKKTKMGLYNLDQYLPYWKKKMDEEKAHSVRFITQTQSGPCTLAIYINHHKYDDGQKMLQAIRDILLSLQ
jgi:hypothetical protein